MRLPVAFLGLVLAATACAGGGDDRPADWSFIHPAIIRPNCTTSGCHSKLSTTGGLNLETPESAYVELVGGMSTGEQQEGLPQNFVVPGHPLESKLLYLLRGDEIWRMPPESPLPDSDIELIERWILEGAQFN